MPFPKGTQGQTVSGMTNQTLAGTFSSNQELTLSNALFPELHRSQKLKQHTSQNLQSIKPLQYDTRL